MKRILAVLLSMMMVLGLFGCVNFGDGDSRYDEDEREESRYDEDEDDEDEDDEDDDKDDNKDDDQNAGNDNSGANNGDNNAGAVDEEWLATQDAILDYINEDVVALGTIEAELLTSYGSVTGANYISDAVTYAEFTSKTLGLAQSLNNEAAQMAGTITDERVMEVHKLYMDYSTKFLNVIIIMISAIEDQDVAQVTQANEILNEANQLAMDYSTALRALADEYEIEILTE